MTFRTTNCTSCKHHDETMCCVIRDQFLLAEERIVAYALAHHHHLPEVDIVADCHCADRSHQKTAKQL